jgi:predicted hydrocarbon binding protein
MSGLPHLRERLVWTEDGSLRDGEIRYLLMRTDSLMQLFKRLDTAARLEALQVFAESLAENGRKSLETRMRRLNLTRDQLYDDLARSSATQLGWGLWTFRRNASDRFEVDVVNSPFADGFGPADHPVCYPIAGMLSAMGELVLGSPVDVKETSCAANSNGCCRFTVICRSQGAANSSLHE